MNVKVRLLKPHTHDGKDLKAGDVIAVDADRAGWLKGQGVAETIANDKRSDKNKD